MDPVQWLTASKSRIAIALTAFVLVGIPLHLGLKSATWASSPSLLPLNARAPQLMGPTVAGGFFESTTSYGRVRVYFFIDPAIKPAEKQGEALRDWNAKYQDDRVIVVPVFTAGEEKMQKEFLTRYGLDPASAVVDRGNTRAIQFNIVSAPAVYVVDGNGRVRFAADKAISARKLKSVVDPYLPQENLLQKRKERP